MFFKCSKLVSAIAAFAIGTTSFSIASVALHSPAIAQASQTTARTNQVTGFELLQGNPSWRSQIISRVAQSSFVFYSNGYFEFHSPGRTDVYPLTGEYERNGNTLYFTAFGSNGSSSDSAMSGSLNIGTSVATIEVVAGSSISACLITGCSGVNSNSHYRVQMQVQ